MIAVNEINVGVAGRAEQDGRSRGIARGRVSRGIVHSEVGLDFDDAGSEAKLAEVTDQYFAQEFASYATRTSAEEFATERTERR